MKTKILASVLVGVFAWVVCGVGDVQAAGSLEDMPSTGDFVMFGVAVVLVVTVIVMVAVHSGGGEKGAEGEAEGKEIIVSGIEPAATPQLRIDPVITLRKHAVGAGVAFSF